MPRKGNSIADAVGEVANCLKPLTLPERRGLQKLMNEHLDVAMMSTTEALLLLALHKGVFLGALNRKKTAPVQSNAVLKEMIRKGVRKHTASLRQEDWAHLTKVLKKYRTGVTSYFEKVLEQMGKDQ